MSLARAAARSMRSSRHVAAGGSGRSDRFTTTFGGAASSSLTLSVAKLVHVGTKSLRWTGTMARRSVFERQIISSQPMSGLGDEVGPLGAKRPSIETLPISVETAGSISLVLSKSRGARPPVRTRRGANDHSGLGRAARIRGVGHSFCQWNTCVPRAGWRDKFLDDFGWYHSLGAWNGEQTGISPRRIRSLTSAPSILAIEVWS